MRGGSGAKKEVQKKGNLLIFTIFPQCLLVIGMHGRRKEGVTNAEMPPGREQNNRLLIATGNQAGRARPGLLSAVGVIAGRCVSPFPD